MQMLCACALSGSRVMSMTERTYKHINTSLYSIRLLHCCVGLNIYSYIPHSVHLQTLSKYSNFLFSTCFFHYFVFQPFLPIWSYVYGWALLAGARSIKMWNVNVKMWMWVLLILIADEKPQQKGGETGWENGEGEKRAPLKIWHGPRGLNPALLSAACSLPQGGYEQPATAQGSSKSLMMS